MLALMQHDFLLHRRSSRATASRISAQQTSGVRHTVSSVEIASFPVPLSAYPQAQGRRRLQGTFRMLRRCVNVQLWSALLMVCPSTQIRVYLPDA